MSETDNTPIVEVSNLKKVFKDFWGREKVTALHDVSMSIHKKEVCALIGPNGSGKTTLVKILLGLLFPTSGGAQVFGQNCFDISNKYRIGFLAEENCFYKHLSGEETLNFYGKLLNLPYVERRDRVQELLKLVGMEHAAKRPLGEYSLGMLRRIGIAQALLADPELLILDEPTNGLDPLGIEEVHNLILSLKERGKAILISTHLLAESDAICDQLILLHQGHVLAEGKTDQLHQDYGTNSMKEIFLKLVKKSNSERAADIEASLPEQDQNEPPSGPDQNYLDQLSK
jgi:ABC-2 type transport system ATP-binding protein